MQSEAYDGTARSQLQRGSRKTKFAHLSLIVHLQRQTCYSCGTVAGLGVGKVVDEPRQDQVDRQPAAPRSRLQQIGTVRSSAHDITRLGNEPRAYQANNRWAAFSAVGYGSGSNVVFESNGTGSIHACQESRRILAHSVTIRPAARHACMCQRAPVAVIAVHRHLDYAAGRVC